MDWDQTAVQPSENHVSVTLIGKNTYTEHKNHTLEQWKQATLQDDAGSSGKKCEGLLQRAWHIIFKQSLIPWRALGMCRKRPQWSEYPIIDARALWKARLWMEVSVVMLHKLNERIPYRMCAIIKTKGPTVKPVYSQWSGPKPGEMGALHPESMSISFGDLLGNKQGAAYPINWTEKLGVCEKLIWFHSMWISPALMKIQRNKKEKHQISSRAYLEKILVAWS